MAYNLKLLFLKNNNGANIFSVIFNFHCTQKSEAVIWNQWGYDFRHWLFSPATMELREFRLGLDKEVLMDHCYVGSKLHLRVA